MTSLNIYGAYVVAAGQSLYYTDPDAAQDVILLNQPSVNPVPPGSNVTGSYPGGPPHPDSSLTILGSVGMVFDANTFVAGIGEVNGASNSPSFVTIGVGGGFALASEGQAFGYWGEAPFTNNGSFYVSARTGAIGVWLDDFGNGKVNSLSGFDNTGSFTVSAPGAEGVIDVRDHFFNSGTITVAGAGSSAAGIVYGAAVTNSGVITANQSALSIGYPPNTFNGTINPLSGIVFAPMTITNTGVITAASAISMPQIGALHLENSGTINGDISAGGPVTSAGSYDGSVIHNTGAINGKITLDSLGDDVYDGRAGTLSGGIYLGGGYDRVYLGNDGETVFGNSTFMAVGLGLRGRAYILGGSGADHIMGGSGDDVIDGGGGDDVLDGGNGVSSLGLPIASGTNTVSFASATSGVTVSLALQGQAQDTLDGVKTLSHFQNLTGSAYADHLTGDASDNVIAGGGGNDTLTGGLGADTFVLHAGSGQVTVTDFSHAQGDRLDLRGLQGLQSFNDVLRAATQSGPDTVIAFPGGGGLTLHGVQLSSLVASDVLVSAISDVNGDGGTDVLFRNGATGAWGFMSANASGGETWHAIGPSSADYAMIGKGDFNADGALDVAFRQTSTGDWGFLTPNPSGGETWHAAGPSSTAYAAVAAQDFNGDGTVDIAFRNIATGDWGFMSANPSGGETWRAVGPSSTAYAVIGSGDFNGDGLQDLAFRNSATGDWGFLTPNPSGGGETWHAIGPTSLAYDAIAALDFNNDGTTDIAFRNGSTGDWGLMSANTSGGGEAWRAIGPSSPDYAVIGSGDFNGDGLKDVAFRQLSTGDWGYLTVNPTGGETWHFVGPSSTDYVGF